MSDEEEVLGWTGLRRWDGAMITIHPNREGGIMFVLRAPPQRDFGVHGIYLTLCPCCQRPFETKQTAKLVANAVCPVL